MLVFMTLEEFVAVNAGVAVHHASNIISLYDEGATIPFVSRYRKDMTGNLDETGVAASYDAIKVFRELIKRKEFITAEIDKKGRLSEELRKDIEECFDPKKLEDIYLPYKEKRKTKAEKAREAGLGMLAEIFLGSSDAGDPYDVASGYLNAEMGYGTPEKAVEGAVYIMAQNMIEQAPMMDFFIKTSLESGRIEASVKKGFDGSDRRFEDYYGYAEKISALLEPKNSHRYLAIRRGEETGAITIKTDIPEKEHIRAFFERYGVSGRFYLEIVNTAVNVAYSEYLRPAIDTRIRQELFEKAQGEAISVFARNLDSLFMAPPIPYRNAIGMDPGIRTGIKTAVLDKDGRFICNTVLYMHNEASKDKSVSLLAGIIKKYGIGAIGVGTGTGSKEAFAIAQKAAAMAGGDIITALVDEAGASVYSASDIAREEFPDLDVTVRGAISIGRRLQNPLAELVKTDPRSIGVGQYQHDVDQKKLREELERVIQKCVNSIGVDINTASYSILSKISGLTEKTARNIVAYRCENGFFRDRSQIKKVKGIGPKAFEQCAGFLRIREGVNPLDSTRVHPEAYSLVEEIASDLGASVRDMIGNASLIGMIDPDRYSGEKIGRHYIESIAEDLRYPARDPRKEFRAARFLDGIDSIEDLREGMELEGRVTNVTNFGAFIDIGVHQDGLCHISKMADSYVRNPADIAKAGDIFRVRVLSADPYKKRISLQMLGKAD